MTARDRRSDPLRRGVACFDQPSRTFALQHRIKPSSCRTWNPRRHPQENFRLRGRFRERMRNLPRMARQALPCTCRCGECRRAQSRLRRPTIAPIRPRPARSIA
jgi:hypothetical protein